MSFDTEMSDTEFKLLVKDLLPDFIDSCEELKSLAVFASKSEISIKPDLCFTSSNIRAQDSLKSLSRSGKRVEAEESDYDKENQVSKVFQWRQNGLESMIDDIKQELGMDEDPSTPKFSVEKDEEMQKIEDLGLLHIDEYINQDFEDKYHKIEASKKIGSRIPTLCLRKKSSLVRGLH